MESGIKLPSQFVLQINELGFIDSDIFFSSLNSKPKTSIRVNPNKEFVNSLNNKISWSQYGFYLNERPVFTLDPLFHAGTYYVQEASSMFLEQAIVQYNLNQNPLRVLDLCASPGGKTTHLSSLLHRDSLVVSNEVIKSRQAPLIENVVKWGNNNCIVTNNDAKDFSMLINYFDVIVCDAPCSGEGLFRKDKNAISEWSLQNVELCASRQQRIINDVWPALKPGGVFIYSTCTFNQKENEENINCFCNELNAECLSLDISEFDGIICNEENKAICYRFFPHLIGGEGFCMSVLKKKEDAFISDIKFKSTSEYIPVQSKIKKLLAEFVLNPDEKIFYAYGKNLFCVNPHHERDLAILQTLRISFAGTGLGEFKHDDFIPSYELALSTSVNKGSFQFIDVDKNTALQILKGQTQLDLNCNDGYALVSYQNIPFAFLKKTSKRFNNLYNKSWYIRMNID